MLHGNHCPLFGGTFSQLLCAAIRSRNAEVLSEQVGTCNWHRQIFDQVLELQIWSQRCYLVAVGLLIFSFIANQESNSSVEELIWIKPPVTY